MNKQRPFFSLLITSLFTLSAYGGSGPPVDSYSQDAESDLVGIIDNTDASYELRETGDAIVGSYSFHLSHPTFASNNFQLADRIDVTADTVLSFFSKIGFATSSQISKVQLSTDNGTTWSETIFEKPGVTGSPTDSAYTFEEISLSSYAGQVVCVRFLYDFSGGSAYTSTGSHVGWLVDNIQIGSDTEKLLYSIGDPSDAEQLYLEYINRARADAMVEAVRLTTETDPDVVSAVSNSIESEDIIAQFQYYVDNDLMQQHAQPLSFHEDLLTASDAHSQDLFVNEFQGHVSSSDPPVGDYPPGATMGVRITSTGYSWGNLGENVYSYARSVAHGHAGFNIDWGDTQSDPIPDFVGQGMQNQAGHRKTIHNDTFKEIGIGVVSGTNGSVGPQVVTQNFARQQSSPTFITGVVYEDLDNDSFYDLGEGVSGVTVNVAGSPFYAVSSTSGGYSIPVSADGTYEVTFTGTDIVTTVSSAVVESGKNVKVDLIIEMPTIEAVNDTLGALAGNTTSLPSVFTNDLANGVTATTSDTRRPTVISDPDNSGITFNANGTATLPSDLAAGSYTVVYEICLKSDNTICSQATLSFQIPETGFSAFLTDYPDLDGGWEDDYDGDGLPDGAEYAMGLDPTDASDASSVMNYSRTPSADGNTVTLSAPLSEMEDDVLYQFHTSSDLDNWSPLEDAEYASGTLSASVSEVTAEKFFIQWVFTQQ